MTKKTIGPYEIHRRLAVGGAAEIYLARKGGLLGFEQHYALKVLLPQHQEDKEHRKMMIDEARLTAQLDHPNIIKVHDLGEDDGTLYMVMEYLNGLNLAQVLARLEDRGLKMPIDAAVHIAREVCSGLHYAHTRRSVDGKPLNLVHRDVSPQNILVGFGGEVKLVDFGVAKATVGGRLETKTGVIKGKITYMAPEYAVGSLQDQRADVFATGLCLWEMLVGRPAYDIVDPVELVEAVKTARIKRPSSERGGVPGALENVLERALEENPEARWSDAATLHAALSEFQSGYAAGYGKDNLSTWMQTLRKRPKNADTEEEPAGPGVDDDDDVAETTANTDIIPPGIADSVVKKPFRTATGLPAVGLDDGDSMAAAVARAQQADDYDEDDIAETQVLRPDDYDDDAEPSKGHRRTSLGFAQLGTAEDEAAPNAMTPEDRRVTQELVEPSDAAPIQIEREFTEGEDVALLPTEAMAAVRVAPPAIESTELPTDTALSANEIRGQQPARVHRPTQPAVLQPGQSGEVVVPDARSSPAVAVLPAPVVATGAHQAEPEPLQPSIVVDASAQQQPELPALQKRVPGQEPPPELYAGDQKGVKDNMTALISKMNSNYGEYSKTESGRRANDAIIVGVLGLALFVVLVWFFFFSD